MKHTDAQCVGRRPISRQVKGLEGDAMCELCEGLNCQIETCRRMEEETNDALMLEALATLIVAYEDDKNQLHLVSDMEPLGHRH
jgi:hypothetical protein